MTHAGRKFIKSLTGNAAVLKQAVPTRRLTDSMTSRKTSFFLYLMPSDLQETALVTVAGGLGAPVSSLWPSWVMYLTFEKMETVRRKRGRRAKTTLGRDEFSHNNKGEQRVSGLIREDRLTRFCTQRGKPTVDSVSITLYLQTVTYSSTAVERNDQQKQT